MARLAIIGAGMMGEALSRGLLASGWAPDDLVLTDVRSERLEGLRDALGVSTASGNQDAVEAAEGVLLAVKPQDAATVLSGLSEAIGDRGVLSIIAGLSTAAVEEGLGGRPQVVRAMPNTPARVGKGVTALAAGRHAGEGLRALAAEVFSAVGPVVWVPEGHLDTVTAISGSGPAYVCLVAESLVEAGVASGLPRDVAETLVFATIEGAGRMLSESGESPAVLRAQVTSPGGTTAAGLAALEDAAVRAAFGRAVRAAEQRSRDLGG